MAVSLAKVSPPAWLGLAGLIFFQTLRSVAFDNEDVDADWGFLGLLWLTAGFSVFLWWRMRKTFNALHAAYTDPARVAALCEQHGAADDILGYDEAEHEASARRKSPNQHRGAICCGFGDTTLHEGLFWLKTPQSILHGLQFCLLAISCALAAWTAVLWDDFVMYSLTVKVIVQLMTLVPVLFMLLGTVPWTVHRLVLATSTASMWRKEHVRRAVEHAKRMARKGLLAAAKLGSESGTEQESEPTHWRITPPHHAE
jgi:hypothetical protein